MVVNPRVLKRSFILLATILTLAACQDDPPPDDPPPPEPEPPRVEATIEEYAVKGDDCDEVRSALLHEVVAEIVVSDDELRVELAR